MLSPLDQQRRVLRCLTAPARAIRVRRSGSGRTSIPRASNEVGKEGGNRGINVAVSPRMARRCGSPWASPYGRGAAPRTASTSRCSSIPRSTSWAGAARGGSREGSRGAGGPSQTAVAAWSASSISTGRAPIERTARPSARASQSTSWASKSIGEAERASGEERGFEKAVGALDDHLHLRVPRQREHDPGREHPGEARDQGVDAGLDGDAGLVVLD